MKEDSPTKHFFIPHALSRQVQGTRTIYITHLNIRFVSEEEKQTVAWISAQLGENSWKDAIIIFIHERRTKRAWNLASVLKRRSDMLRLTVAAHVGWDIASSIITIIIDASDNPLTDSQRWLQHHSPFACTYQLIPTGAREVTLLTITPQQLKRHPAHIQPAYSLPHHVIIFIYFYLSCAPIGMICMFVTGISGYIIACFLTFLLWMLLTILRVIR